MHGGQSFMDSLAVVAGKVSCVLDADRISSMLQSLMTEDLGDGDNAHHGVSRYRPAANEALQYGSLIIEGAPRQALVNDSQACELPSSREAWRQVANACFDQGGHPVPVLNLPRVFGDAL